MHRFCYPILAAAFAASMITGCSTTAGVAVKAKVVEPAATLDGLYRIVIDGKGNRNGKDVDDLVTSDEQWAFRTTCDADGCVATGGLFDPENPAKPPEQVVVADYVDGKWSIVTVVEDTCVAFGRKVTANRWTAWDIGVTPAKALSLTRTDIGASTCNYVEVSQTTMSRIGDRPPGFELPDSAAQKDRSDPPAAKEFHGNYDLTVTNRVDADSVSTANDDVTTTCLRDEERCIATAFDAEPRDPGTEFTLFTLEFADGQFVGTYSENSPPCNGSVGGSKTQTLTVALPEHQALGPIEHLTGERATSYPGGCPTVTEDMSFDRIR